MSAKEKQLQIINKHNRKKGVMLCSTPELIQTINKGLVMVDDLQQITGDKFQNLQPETVWLYDCLEHYKNTIQPGTKVSTHYRNKIRLLLKEVYKIAILVDYNPKEVIY